MSRTAGAGATNDETPAEGRGLERPIDACVADVATQDSGAPGGTRTHDLQVRNLALYPLSYGRTKGGGEGGIRTLEAGYPTWRFSKPLH
jgi:hypothetical protein